MKLVALTTMKIEGDVVEEFLRHTLRFVDSVVIFDNGSLDAGPEIVQALIDEGLPITVWRREPGPQDESLRTRVVRRAFAAFEPDYLFLIDVDEFIRAPSRHALEASLRTLDGAHAVLPWVTYVPAPGDPPGEQRVLARITHRLARESRPHAKVAIHASFADSPDATIGRGNHTVIVRGENIALIQAPGVDLAHFPVRSLHQVQCKALLGWPTSLSMGSHTAPGTDYQWRQLNDRLLSDPNWTRDDFLESAWHYLDEDGSSGQPALLVEPLQPVDVRYRRAQPELLSLSIAFMREMAVELWLARSHQPA